MNDLNFIFKMPEETTLAKVISVKGEKGDVGNIGDVKVNGASVVKNGIAVIEGMITNAVDDLKNYYLKEEVNEMVSAIPKFSIEVVTELPTDNISNATIYLLLSGSEASNLYNEYIYIDDSWEKLGTQKVDLSNFYNKEETYSKKEIEGKLEKKVDVGNSLIVSATEPTGDNREKVWIQKTDDKQKIYVLNDDGIYEEFINKEDTLIKHSTEEQLIGKWHNGNNVYRKTLLIDVTFLNAEQEHFINYSDYGISGNIVVNNYKGLCERSDQAWQVLPCTLEEWHIDIYDFKETQFTIKISQNQKNMGLTTLTLVLEYEYRYH